MQRVNYQISLYFQHENRNIERVGNLERTKDGMNKMREMSKRGNYIVFPGWRRSSYYRSDEIK